MAPLLSSIALALLTSLPLVHSTALSRASIAIHGHGVGASRHMDTSFQHAPSYNHVPSRTHTFLPRAPKSTIAPNITDRSWINGALSRIDLWREQHSALPLVWSTTLANYALQSANKCVLAHTGGPYGECIYWISSTAIDHYTVMKQGIDAWGIEYLVYNASDPYEEAALHFTALVWKNAKRVGCAWTSTTCPQDSGPGGGWYLFCEFDPPTNVLGRFAANVDPVHREIGTY